MQLAAYHPSTFDLVLQRFERGSYAGEPNWCWEQVTYCPGLQTTAWEVLVRDDEIRPQLLMCRETGARGTYCKAISCVWNIWYLVQEQQNYVQMMAVFYILLYQNTSMSFHLETSFNVRCSRWNLKGIFKWMREYLRKKLHRKEWRNLGLFVVSSISWLVRYP